MLYLNKVYTVLRDMLKVDCIEKFSQLGAILGTDKGKTKEEIKMILTERIFRMLNTVLKRTESVYFHSYRQRINWHTDHRSSDNNDSARRET